MIAKNHGQTKNVGPSNLLQKLCENHWRQLGFRQTSPSKTFRFLMNKFLFARDEVFSEEDEVSLFLSWEKMVQICAVDRQYHSKHFQWIWVTRIIVQGLRKGKTISSEMRHVFLKQISGLLSFGRGYFSASQYYGLKEQKKLLYELWMKTRFPRKFPPKKHVGVGYNDSGTARDHANDGSPHWTEVAMCDDGKGLERQSRTTKVDQLFQQLLIHPIQAIGNYR